MEEKEMEEKEYNSERLLSTTSPSASESIPSNEHRVELFEIKEISIQQALACEFSPSCDCSPY